MMGLKDLINYRRSMSLILFHELIESVAVLMVLLGTRLRNIRFWRNP